MIPPHLTHFCREIAVSAASTGPDHIAQHRAFWRLPAATLLAELKTSAAGLSEVEAEARLARVGPNRFDAAQVRPLLKKIATRLANPLIAILLIAAAVSGARGDGGSFLSSSSGPLLDRARHRPGTEGGGGRRALRRSSPLRRRAPRRPTKALPVATSCRATSWKLRDGDLVPADGIVLEAVARSSTNH